MLMARFAAVALGALVCCPLSVAADDTLLMSAMTGAQNTMMGA